MYWPAHVPTLSLRDCCALDVGVSTGLRRCVTAATVVVGQQRSRYRSSTREAVLSRGMRVLRVEVDAVEQPVKLVDSELDHGLLTTGPSETIHLESFQSFILYRTSLPTALLRQNRETSPYRRRRLRKSANWSSTICRCSA